MVLWKWIVGGGTTLLGIIAAPVADSLVKEGKLPDGLGAVLSTLWGWITVRVSMPLLALLTVGILLFLLGMIVVWIFSGNVRVDTPGPEALTADQLNVFSFVGQAVDNEQDVTLDLVMRGVSLSRVAAEHALEALSERDLISWCVNFHGPDYYLLTNSGRGYYLDLVSSAANQR